MAGSQRSWRGTASYWRGCWKRPREKPTEETETQRLLKALIGRLDQHQGTLQRIEKGIGTVGNALDKAGDQPSRVVVRAGTKTAAP